MWEQVEGCVVTSTCCLFNTVVQSSRGRQMDLDEFYTVGLTACIELLKLSVPHQVLHYLLFTFSVGKYNKPP